MCISLLLVCLLDFVSVEYVHFTFAGLLCLLDFASVVYVHFTFACLLFGSVSVVVGLSVWCSGDLRSRV